MAILDPVKLAGRFQKAVADRQTWEGTWDKIYDLAFPGRQGFFSETQGQQRASNIFDSTLMDATNEFASRMAFGLTPNFSEWFRLEPGPRAINDLENDKKKLSEVRRQMDSVTRYVFNVIQSSNFQSANHELMLDLSVGYSVLEINENRDPARVLAFSTLPQTQCYLGLGPDGKVDQTYRKFSATPTAIRVMYPDATLPRGLPEDKLATVVDAIYRDWDKLDDEVHHRAVCVQGDQSDLSAPAWQTTYTGQGSNPRIVVRWMTTPLEAYGRGPAYLALPDARTANLATQLVLENAEMAISGMWQADDDGVINVNTIRLVPGTVFPRDPDSRGLEPLTSPARFDISQLLLDQLRSQIRRTMFAMDFGPDSAKTPRSATEITERSSNQAGRISSPFARLMNEYIEPLIDRVVYILKERGLVQLPKRNGKDVQIISRSPLARAQRMEEVYNLQQFYSVLAGIYNVAAPAFLKEQETAGYLASRLEIPEDLLTDEDEREAAMQQIVSAMQPPQGQP